MRIALAALLLAVLVHQAGCARTCKGLKDCPMGEICSSDGVCITDPDPDDGSMHSNTPAEGEGDAPPPPPPPEGECGTLSSVLLTDHIYVLGTLDGGGPAIADVNDLETYGTCGIDAAGTSLQVQTGGRLVYAAPEPFDPSRRTLHTWVQDREGFVDTDGDGTEECVYPSDPLANDISVFTGCGPTDSVYGFIVQQGSTDLLTGCLTPEGDYSVVRGNGEDALFFSLAFSFNSSDRVLGIDYYGDDRSLVVDDLNDPQLHAPVPDVLLHRAYGGIARAAPEGFKAVGVRNEGTATEEWVLYQIGNDGSSFVIGVYQHDGDGYPADARLEGAVLDTIGNMYAFGAPGGVPCIYQFSIGAQPVIVASDGNNPAVKVRFGRLFTGDGIAL